jgi:hypothetical protein
MFNLFLEHQGTSSRSMMLMLTDHMNGVPFIYLITALSCPDL